VRIKIFLPTLLLHAAPAVALAQSAEPPPVDPTKSDLPVVQMQNTAGTSSTSTPISGTPAASPRAPTPAAATGGTNDWKFDWHGYMRAPLGIGVGTRDNPKPGESSTTFHAPVVPDDQYLSWQYTGAQSRAWAEVFLTVGNSWAKGTIGLLGFNFTDAAWNDGSAQFGIAQGFVTLTPDLPYENVRLEAKVGSFWANYGKAGRYDAGMYDTYLFGRTHVLGETVRGEIDIGKLTLWAEEGFGGKRPNPSVYDNARFTLLHHEHAGARYGKEVEFGLHHLYAWSQEEARAGQTATGLTDGSIRSMGADIKVDTNIGGMLYLGWSYAKADHGKTVAPAIEFIHSFGGGDFNLGFVDNYLEGPTRKSGGNGHVQTLLGQYEFSLTNFFMNLEKPGSHFWGDGMDLTLTLFGMMNFVTSDDPDANGIKKIKYGGDLNWSALSWLGLGARVDRVQPNSTIPEQSFGVISPRIYFRSKFVTHEMITLQYSRYFYNERTCAAGAPPIYCVQPPPSPVLPDGFGALTTNQSSGNRAAPTNRPDLNVIKLQATVWW
jgi:hypothetical protein